MTTQADDREPVVRPMDRSTRRQETRPTRTTLHDLQQRHPRPVAHNRPQLPSRLRLHLPLKPSQPKETQPMTTTSTTRYKDFLETKRRDVKPNGPQGGECHPMLYGWQSYIVNWAVRQGRAAIFADCGLGKTFMQIEWARLIGGPVLILAPLSVARQTVHEAAKIGVAVNYVRDDTTVDGSGIWITNYEMAHYFDPDKFAGVVLDESSILKNHTGKFRNNLISQWARTDYRLACTATPAPNDVTELTNHSEFLGVMPRTEMLAAYFVHDQDGWRVKGHAHTAMFRWMSHWAVAIRKPSDLDYPDDGFELPPLTIESHIVEVNGIAPDGQLFATELGGVSSRSKVRKHTSADRISLTVELVNSTKDQWIVWCGLNDEAAELAKNIDGAVNVHGSMEPDAKADAMESFQTGDIRVLITKPRIAGFGMNFQNCHRMVFCGLGDSYEQYYQSIRRCYRFGQTKPVEAHIVLSELESQIAQNVRRKENETNAMTTQLVQQMKELHL